jgi:hypothetical protein
MDNVRPSGLHFCHMILKVEALILFPPTCILFRSIVGITLAQNSDPQVNVLREVSLQKVLLKVVQSKRKQIFVKCCKVKFYEHNFSCSRFGTCGEKDERIAVLACDRAWQGGYTFVLRHPVWIWDPPNVISPWVKQPVREFVHSSPSSVKLRMSGDAPPLSLYVLASV